VLLLGHALATLLDDRAHETLTRWSAETRRSAPLAGAARSPKGTAANTPIVRGLGDPPYGTEDQPASMKASRR
jgi:hypothetical protein